MKYKPPKCAICKKQYSERWNDNGVCVGCNEVELNNKISNRDTELQRAYDIACYNETAIEAEIFDHENAIKELKVKLKSARDMMDLCIKRESELGIKVL